MPTLVGFATLLFAALPVAQDDGIAWLTDLAEARALATQAGKPMLVVFRCET